MKDIIYDFLDYISFEKNYSDYTEVNYEVDLFKYEEYLEKHSLDYRKVKYANINDFIISLSLAKYKSTTINRILSTLRSFYNYLEMKKLIDSNPFSYVSNLKTEKRLPNYFKYDEYQMMIDSTDDTALGYRNRIILELLISTGIRVGELSNIKINDIDIHNREIRVFGKGKKERIVYFTSEVQNNLNNYITSVRNELLKNHECDYLLVNNLGSKLSTRGIRLIIENIVKKSCVRNKITPHTFRHTFATMLLNEGCNIKSVQELLGHSSISTTGIYTHLTNSEIRNQYLKAHPRSRK